MTFPQSSEPEVVRLMRQFKLALLADEQTQMTEMARRWRQLERALEGRMEALALEIGELRTAGEAVNIERLLKMPRYKALLAQLQEESRRYVDYADDAIATGQRRYLSLGIEHAAKGIQASYLGSGITAGFDMLAIGAVEAMAGFVGDGTPLNVYLRRIYPDAAGGMLDALMEAITLGWNPRKTALEMARGTGVGLQHALNTARTEQLRAYREASRLQYQQSGVVRGYKRLSARDNRTCIACLLADGQFYELGETFEEHNQGRCTQVPVVIGMPEVSWQSGKDWLLRQDAETQRAIMGSGRFEAWRDGAFDLEALVSRREDAVWGNALVPTPLNQLIGN